MCGWLLFICQVQPTFNVHWLTLRRLLIMCSDVTGFPSFRSLYRRTNFLLHRQLSPGFSKSSRTTRLHKIGNHVPDLISRNTGRTALQPRAIRTKTPEKRHTGRENPTIMTPSEDHGNTTDVTFWPRKIGEMSLNYAMQRGGNSLGERQSDAGQWSQIIQPPPPPPS